MMSKILNRGTVWALLLISLVFLNKSAYPEEKENFKLRLSFKLTGGWAYTSIGDINSHLESFNNNETFEEDRRMGSESIMGEITKLNNWSSDWEAELRLDISPHFAVGLATSGALHQKNEDCLSMSGPGAWGGWTDILTFRPEIKARMPVKLGIYYSFPLVSRVSVFSTAGIGYYSASISKYERFREILYPGRGIYGMWKYWETNRNSSLGFHGGIGMECSLTKNLALVLEAQGRYVKIKNLKGTRQEPDSNDPFKIYERQGTLYYYFYSRQGMGSVLSNFDLDIYEEPPWGTIPEISISDVRKAVIDLSGFSLRVGLRIKLF